MGLTMFSVYMLVPFSFSSSIKLSPKPSKQKYAQVLFIFPGKPRMTSYRRNPSVVEERNEKHDSRVFKTCMRGENMMVFWDTAGNKFLFSNENKLVGRW